MVVGGLSKGGWGPCESSWGGGCQCRMVSRKGHACWHNLGIKLSYNDEKLYHSKYLALFSNLWGVPPWLNSKESTCQYRRCGFSPCVRKMPWRRKWLPTPLFLPGKPQGQRSLVGYSLWGCKSWTQLSN